jgi:polysaccharide pyruvyl transferase WcaK-like protein
MKICVLGASFDTGNMGVNALAVGTVRAILHRWPEAEVFFLNYQRYSEVYTLELPGRRVAVPLVNMRFSWRFWLRNNIAFLIFLSILMKLLPLPVLRRQWIAGNDCLRHLDESDFVAAISGGDSFSDIYGLERLIYVTLPQILALWGGKRLILLPQTLGPFKSRIARTIAKYIMKRAEVIYSRDHVGVKLVTEMLGEKVRSPKAEVRRPESRVPSPESRTPDPASGALSSKFPAPDSKVRFCYDVGFVLESIPPPQIDLIGLPLEQLEAHRLVGLNVSGLLYMGGYTRKNAFGLKTDYPAFIRALIAFLIEEKKANVILIPHVFGTGGECDSPVCNRLFEELKDKYPGRLGVLQGAYNQGEIKYIIGLCEFFIGARMHACIAALSQNVPAVAFAYSDKFAGVMETVGVGNVVVDPRKRNEKEILHRVGQIFDARAQVREELTQIMPHVKETVLGLFSPVQGLPGGGHAAAVTSVR